jgi:hypothetical protein
MEKTGRNDPCSCGSGLKFKKCCETKKTSNKKINAQILPSSTDSLASRVNVLGKLFQKSPSPEEPSILETPETSPNETLSVEPS